MKALQRIKGELSFGPSFNIGLPVTLSIDRFDVTGGLSGPNTASYSNLQYGGNQITATGPVPFDTAAQPSRLTPRLSQKIEFVFSASPETSGREPQELPLHCPDVKVRDLADCAPSDLFSFPGSGGLCRCAAVILIFHKYSFAAIDCEQIRH